MGAGIMIKFKILEVGHFSKYWPSISPFLNVLILAVLDCDNVVLETTFTLTHTHKLCCGTTIYRYADIEVSKSLLHLSRHAFITRHSNPYFRCPDIKSCLHYALISGYSVTSDSKSRHALISGLLDGRICIEFESISRIRKLGYHLYIKSWNSIRIISSYSNKLELYQQTRLVSNICRE